MNSKLLTIALATTTLLACSEAVDPSTDAPLDPEHGLESLDGRDDSFAVRPGSPEADAVLEYVNRDIADDAAGVVFLDDLDSKLHAWAARNIAEFRSGPDGTFGNADDRKFETLSELDGVPWVGRSALMQLFGLAEAAGLFQRPTVDCADYVDHDRYNNYRIDSYADLLEVENSRCTTINGNVHIEISGTDLLPPQAREIRNLRFLETINGDLRIIGSNHWTSVHFEKLETVTGALRGESVAGRKHTLEFTALTSAKSIYMSEIASSQFLALEHNDQIYLRDTDLEGFTALETAVKIDIYQRVEGAFDVAFPELTRVEALKFDVYRRNAWTNPNVSFDGSFAKLESANSITLNNGDYGDLAYPVLNQVGTLSTNQAGDAFVGMNKLDSVNRLVSINDTASAGAHTGPTNLQTIGTLTVTTELAVDGYDALELAEGNITIQSQKGLEGFNALETALGTINLNLGRDRNAMEVTGFNSLTAAGAITLNANSTVTAVGAMFKDLEFAGSISIVANSQFDKNLVFESLAGIEGSLRLDVLKDGLDPMPELQLVDGGVTINSTPQELKGFPKLERIEGGLLLKRSVSEITGWANLTAIGLNLSVPRTLQQPELDNFLLQLEEFSGSITYN